MEANLLVYPQNYIINATAPASETAVSDVFLRAVIVQNNGIKPLTLKSLTFDYSNSGQSLKSVSYGAASLAERITSFQKMISKIILRFGDSLIPMMFGPASTLESSLITADIAIAPGKQAGIYGEHLRYLSKTEIDACTVTLTYLIGAKEYQIKQIVPVLEFRSKNQYSFPLGGTWLAMGTFDDGITHRFFPFEEFAMDLATLGPNLETFSGEGRRNQDFPMYGRPVLAVADGNVVSVLDEIPENEPGKQLTTEVRTAITRKYGLASALAGNHIIISHPDGEFSFYAHLLPGSLTVKAGQSLRQGEQIGRLGNSGNSSAPHLHFHLMDGPTLLARSLPIQFMNVQDGGLGPMPLIERNVSLLKTK